MATLTVTITDADVAAVCAAYCRRLGVPPPATADLVAAQLCVAADIAALVRQDIQQQHDEAARTAAAAAIPAALAEPPVNAALEAYVTQRLTPTPAPAPAAPAP